MTTVLALDTEDNGAGLVGIINWFDGHTHYTIERRREESSSNMRARAWAVLESLAPCQVWACNLEYDLINLYGDWIDRLVTLQYVTAGLMRATLDRQVWHGPPVSFYDTMRHWPVRGVAEMGILIGLPKLHVDFTGPRFTPEEVTYCRRDTEIVWRFVTQMLARYAHMELAIRPTTPGMAMQLFRRFWPVPWPEMSGSHRSFHRRGYYGGRVEVYRFERVPGPIHHYDVNSLFPSVMAGHDFPDCAQWTTPRVPKLEREGMADVTLTVPETMYPPCPVRAEDETLYPWGRLRGVWTYPEIRQVLIEGGRIETVHHVIEYPQSCRPFDQFIEFCWDRRQSAPTDMDRVYWKLMMNSLYGKFGMSQDGMLTIKRGREIPVRSALPGYVNVIWAAYVTAYARLRLLALLRSVSDAYYTDTDSVFTPDMLLVSSEIGAVKEEGVYQWAEFHGCKLYVLSTGQAKAKGVSATCGHGFGDPRCSVVCRSSSARDFIRTGRMISRRPARFRESRRSFLIPNVWYDVEKERHELYTKRRRLPDGRTEPWNLREYLWFREG